MHNDPRHLANCEACPLRAYWEKEDDWRPVPSELNPTPIAIVGPFPTKQDTTFQKPMYDHNGVEVIEALKAVGRARQSVGWINVVACRYPADDKDTFDAKLKARNRKLKAAKEDTIPTPQQCCRPRFEAEIAQYGSLIAVGEMPVKEILDGSPNLWDVRGGPTTVGEFHKVLPTIHPDDIRARPEYRDTFRKDIAKAFRFFDDRLAWKPPTIIWNPRPKELRALLEVMAATGRRVVYDVETDGIEPLDANLRCIGLGNKDTVIMVHFLSRDRVSRFYEDDIGPWAGTLSEEAEVVEILKAFLTNPKVKKVGHNAGYYDRMVLESHWGIQPSPLVDSILLHRLAESEYPHRLGFVGSVYTDVPAWKAEHTAVTARTDFELGSYCATDIAVNDAIIDPCKLKAATRQQLHIYQYDAQLQDLCVGMHRVGMRIDEARRKEHLVRFDAERDYYLDILVRAGIKNPNSHDQVRALLYDKWHLPAPKYTQSGEASTDSDSLIALLRSPHADEYQRSIIDAVRMYRRADTIITRYLEVFAPHSEYVRDGYVHADFNTHGTVARLSSSGPNFQNIPAILRDIFIPPPGCVFVDADMDQIELRYVAGLSGCKMYLDSFNLNTIDPHNLTAELMYGDSYWLLPGAPATKTQKGTGLFGDVRTSGKTIAFASIYGARGPKVAEIFLSTEDKKTGKLLYLSRERREVEALRARWLRKVPEIEAWWEATVEFYRKNGYVQECVLGRRRYFHWEDTNAILNFGVQAGAFAVVALGMLDLAKTVPFDFGRRTGLVNQMHDSVTYAVPEARAEEVRDLVSLTLTRTVNTLPVKFTAGAKILDRWGK